MTPEEKKQQFIRDAYGDHYDKFKDIVDEDGWVLHKDFHWLDADDLFLSLDKEHEIWAGYEMECIRWRPQDLAGLERNNGWTIADQYNTSALTPDKRYDIYSTEEDAIHTDCSNIEVCLYFNNYGATHFKEHVEPLKPLY